MTTESYTPESLTITSGESVVWYNNSERRHTVTAYADQIPDEAEYFASGGFDSESEARYRWRGSDSNSKPIPGGSINEGETYAQVLDVPGTYEYFCVPHEEYGMVGTIIVEEK